MSIRTSRFLTALSIFSVLAFSSCGGGNSREGRDDAGEPKEKKIKMEEASANDYKLMVPKHMVKTTDLNDEASLQYQNIYKELYIIVIDEPRDTIIESFKMLGEYDDTKSPVENYRTFLMDQLESNMDIKAEPEIRKEKINGMDAEIVSFNAKVEGVAYEVFYQAAFYEGKNNFYYLSTWTLANKKGDNREEMEAMIKSFKSN